MVITCKIWLDFFWKIFVLACEIALNSDIMLCLNYIFSFLAYCAIILAEVPS